ncbi:MAG: hypothetical protein ABSE51_06595 [Terracidiphilus sp.]|jgi:hypothetical protein
MRIEIQRASNLGQIHRTLGIDSDSRISFQMDARNGQIDIWDLTTGRYFTVSALDSPPTFNESAVKAPEWVEQIVQTPDNDLLNQYRAAWREGAGEKRMAMFTELCYRGISVLP